MTMLPKQQRVTKASEYSRIFKNSRPIFGVNLQVRSIKIDNNPSRFGFIISNKIDKRSTRRNALRRQLRAVIIENYDQLLSGYKVVVSVKKDFDFPYDHKRIADQLMKLLEKTGITKGSTSAQ